jgi:hypothetical protein
MVRTVLDYFGSGMLTSLLITNTVAGQFPFWGSSKPLWQCIIPIPVGTPSYGDLWVAVFSFDGVPWWAYKCRMGRSSAVVGLSKPERMGTCWKACNGCNAGGWRL